MKLHHLPALACAFLALAGSVCADDQEDVRQKDKMVSFMDASAGAVYKLAWPTATYKSWRFDGFSRAPGGYKLTVRLSGLSAFDDSDLWLKLGFLVNSDGLKDMWVVDHNAIIMPPFKTSQTLASITLQLARQYAEAHPSQPVAVAAPTSATVGKPAGAGAVCIVNSTEQALKFYYHWGAAAWQLQTVEAGRAYVSWWTYDSQTNLSSPQFEIEYDSSFAEGYTGQRYALDRYQSSLPVTCANAKQYQFTVQGQSISLTSLN